MPLPEPMLAHHHVNQLDSHLIVFDDLATDDYLYQSCEYHETSPVTKSLDSLLLIKCLLIISFRSHVL